MTIAPCTWRRRVPIAAIVAASLGAGCDVPRVVGLTDPIVVHEMALISGLVLDAETMSPVSGATIEIPGAGSAITEPDGRFTLPRPESFYGSGSVMGFVRAADYVPDEIRLQLRRGALQVPTTLLKRSSPGVSVGPLGGRLSGSGGATLEVPPGALDAMVALSITTLPGTSPYPDDSGNLAVAVARVYIGPAGVRFAKPVRVTIPVSLPPHPGKLAVFARRPGAASWDSVGSAEISPDGFVTFETEEALGHFILSHGVGYWFSKHTSTTTELGETVLLARCKTNTTVATKVRNYSTSFKMTITPPTGYVEFYLGIRQSIPTFLTHSAILSIPIPADRTQTVRVTEKFTVETVTGTVQRLQGGFGTQPVGPPATYQYSHRTGFEWVNLEIKDCHHQGTSN